MTAATDPWDLTDAIAAADARLNRAITAAHQADIELAQSAVHLIALQARHRFPDAWTVVLEWSDQGDHLTLTGLAGVAGAPITPDEDAWNAFLDDGGDNYAANLEGHTEYIWLPYMRPLAGPRNSTDPYHLDILTAASTPRS
ncbi:hypothetical protein SAMN05428985_11536 [Nocardioides sp. YR527]|uniref:hypothetical protein n=1 Tax=Nocardioides sp. YR527 TaxID=1881028 RepID=UPI00088E8C50|nr:hypothetical protein [Nocardioides sp. YR527]SDL34186.1 hypothetical protein SAMN05428985_11536 [Nocardioides sp. YR527]